jgi:hypothetical protein
MEFLETAMKGTKIRLQGAAKFARRHNERPETLSSPGRPGSPPPELLTEEVKRRQSFCIWHFRAIIPRQSASLLCH